MERKNANKSIAIITKKYNIKNRKGEAVAYTIISQNNTTTTLADENGNVITVPARVALATSTDYTIKKVNNNSVDLEDGDGKIIRGVPACVVLAGEGGGGGGSVDYAKTVQRAETMPTANASNAGQQFLYSGESDATYTHGYIYENVTSTTPASATGTQTTGSTLSDITVDGETFWEELEEYEIPQQTGDYAFTYNGETGYWDYGDDYFDLSDFGVTYTGTPTDGDVLTISVTAPSATYAWTRVDVQPAPSGLPDQTGQSGKFLTTDGTDASWGTINALQNTATGTNSITILGTPNTNQDGINIGIGSSAVRDTIAIGLNAKGYRSTVIIGRHSNAFTPLGSYGVAIGDGAEIGTTLGYEVAIGTSAKTAALRAVQLGSGTNSDANTFKVANANGNYEIMSADGTVPTARLTKVNTTATLAVADWSSSTQTVTVSGVKADSVVFVSPASASASDYASAGILCTAQAADSLTFTCTTTPSNAITVNVICF